MHKYFSVIIVACLSLAACSGGGNNVATETNTDPEDETLAAEFNKAALVTKKDDAIIIRTDNRKKIIRTIPTNSSFDGKNFIYLSDGKGFVRDAEGDLICETPEHYLIDEVINADETYVLANNTNEIKDTGINEIPRYRFDCVSKEISEIKFTNYLFTEGEGRDQKTFVRDSEKYDDVALSIDYNSANGVIEKILTATGHNLLGEDTTTAYAASNDGSSLVYIPQGEKNFVLKGVNPRNEGNLWDKQIDFDFPIVSMVFFDNDILAINLNGFDEKGAVTLVALLDVNKNEIIKTVNIDEEVIG